MTTQTTSVSLDLDALEREGTPGPFTVKLAGKTMQFVDAVELNYEKLIKAINQITSGNSGPFYKLALSPDDAKLVISSELSVWKTKALIEAYLEHFGLTNEGELGASSIS